MDSLPPEEPLCPHDCPKKHILGRLYGLMRAMPDSVFEIDDNGKHLFVHAQEGDTPIPPEDIKGATIYEVLPGQLAEEVHRLVREVIADGSTRSMTYTVPPPHKGGPVRHFKATIARTPRSTAIAVVRNVSKDVEQRMKLQEANQALTQFASITSHDLREPIMGIAGYATLLQNRYKDQLDERGQHFIDQIVRVSQQMEQKLDDLLTFSRAGKDKPFEPFSLGAALEEAKRALVRKINESGAEIVVVGDPPKAHGDRSMVAQVLQNLFSNSIKYRRKDEPPRIEVEVVPHDEFFWRIVVRDNGIGFDMRHKDRIFGVFQRLYTTEQYPGTGIGLAIAKRVVERHGGEIWAWSQPDKGTSFYFTLPKAVK